MVWEAARIGQGRVLASREAGSGRPRRGGVVLASSTPDALWEAPSARLAQPAAVHCRGLVRGRLLRGCTFRVPPGIRLLVVADPDATGSVLLRVLAGLAHPRAGRIVIAGIEGPAEASRGGRVAYLGPQPGIHGWMTPREAVQLAAGLIELGGGAAERRIRDALDWVEIGSADLDRPVRRAGPGLAERVGLAAALVGDPEVLLLDEALRSVDPDERARLLRVPGRRRTVLIASRYPRSEAGLVTHAMLLREGRPVLLAPVSDLGRAGLPLTRDGLGTLADRRADEPTAGVARVAPAR
jgi:ABC-type multidrug transport system ATPase subunit